MHVEMTSSSAVVDDTRAETMQAVVAVEGGGSLFLCIG